MSLGCNWKGKLNKYAAKIRKKCDAIYVQQREKE